MSAVTTADVQAHGTTNPRDGSVVTTTITPPPLVFFCPHTAEIVVVDSKNRSSFLQEAKLLEDVVAEHMQARLASEAAQNDLLGLSNHAQLRDAQQALNQRIAEEEAARKKMADAFKTVSPNPGKDMMELLPMWSPAGTHGVPFGKKFTYVRSEKVKNLLRSYKLPGATMPGMKSFLVYNAKNKKWKLDEKKLRDSFSASGQKLGKQLKEIKLKHAEELFDAGPHEWAPDFIHAVNANTHFASPELPDDMTEYAYGAKLLRCFAGASGNMEGELNTSLDDILKGKLKVKAAVKGKGEAALMLAEGRANFKILLPHRKGFELCFLPEIKKTATGATQIDMLSLGFFRLSLDLATEGSVGASVLAEGGIELELDSKGVQKAKGRQVKRDAKSLGKRQMMVNNLSAGANVGAEVFAFAGAKAGAEVAGAFEWQKPESTTFSDFAKITPKLEGMAGAGGGAAFDIGYFPDEKKFKAVVKLAGCVGLGVSGKIGAEIGAGHIMEFAWWFRHQVVASVDSNLKYFQEKAFEAFCAMYTLAIVEGKELGTYLGQTAEELMDYLGQWAQANAMAFIAAIRKADVMLRMALANVKGQINFLLQEIYDSVIELKKDARDTLQWLFGSIYQKAEYANVLQHSFGNFTVAGDATVARSNLVNIIGLPAVASLEGRLKNIPANGFMLARNDDPLSYSMQIGTHMAWRRSSTLTA